MRAPAVLLSFILSCPLAFAGGTVGFNVTSYPTPPFATNDIVDGNCEVTAGVVIADFNRDGIPDVAYSVPVCSASGSGPLIVKMGTGGGKLGTDVQYQFGANDLSGVVSADVNGDGWPDLLIRDPIQGWISVLLNNGDGTFTYSAIVGFGGLPGSFVVGDFNNDGKIDLAEIVCDSNDAGYPFLHANCTLHVGLGDNKLDFKESESIQLAGASYDLHAADINGDGNLDLIFARGNVGVILWGRGNGTFSGPTYLKPPTTDPMDAVAVADFNNDGHLDVALLSGNPCRPTPDDSGCDGPNPNTVWMYKNNGGNSLTLTTHTQFTSQSGAIVAADVNGDLNQDLLHYNEYSSGIYPVLEPFGGFNYALGLGNDTLGSQGSLPGSWISAVAFRDMDGDSRADYAAIDWGSSLDIGIQTGGWTNCPPPSSANLAARICGLSNGSTVSSPLLLKASGNSPVGVGQLQVWIDGKKQYVKWGDQLAKRFSLSAGTHRIAVVANDKYVGHATTTVNVTVR